MTDIASGETLLMRLSLKVMSGKSRGRTASLGRGTVVVGGAADVDFCIEDGRASRRHASFELVPDGVRVRDLHSKNGTRANGVPLQEAVLRPGTVVEIGDTTIAIVGDGEPVQTPAGAAALGDLTTHSGTMRRLFSIAQKAARSDVTVLLMGESGVGKEVVARAIHRESPRRAHDFVVVDCGALAQGLVASELFGHKRGSFTSASEDRVGAFELAKGGTVFLDEVGELPLELQPHLLRVLDRRQVTRVGESAPRNVDVRVLAATNRSLKEEVDKGRFRADLYYRLAVVALTLPSLRERKDEVLTLASGFLAEHGRSLEQIASSDRQRLLEHPFPGNVRELRNLIARSCALSASDATVTLAFDDDGAARVQGDEGFAALLQLPLAQARESLLLRFDEAYLRALLEAVDGNVSEAARRAGVARSYMHRLLARHRGLRGA